MYGQIKKIAANTLAKNFLLLGVIQSANLLIPLLLTPYLVKTVGLTNYGKITFSQSVIYTLNILVDYGFNLSATRSISINRADTKKVNEIYTATLASKALLVILTFLMLCLLLFFPLFSDNKILLLSGFMISLGQMLTPLWAFQGIEKLKVYSVISVIFKTLYIISVFLFIKKTTEYIYVNLFFGASFLFTGIFSLVFLSKKYHFRFVQIPPQKIIDVLHEGFHYFISAFSISINSYSNSAILTLFTTDFKSVGLYGIVEKIMQIAKQVLVIYSQVIHPAACRIVDKSYPDYKKFLRRVYLPFLVAFSTFCICLYIFAPVTAHFFNASDIYKAAALIRIIVFALIITCLNIPAYLSLLALHFPKSYSSVFLGSSVISILSNIVLTSTFGVYGCVFNILITEFLIMAGLHLMLQFKHKEYALFNL